MPCIYFNESNEFLLNELRLGSYYLSNVAEIINFSKKKTEALGDIIQI